MIDEASIRNMSPVQLIDALMQHVDDLQSESGAIPEDSIRWQRMLEIDAAIAVAIEKLPDTELRGDCSRIGFCRIPYSSVLTGHVLVTDAGYVESGQTWRQMMRILRAQCSGHLRQSPDKPIQDEYEYHGFLLTAERVANCFFQDRKPLFSTSSLQRWEIGLASNLKSAGQRLDAKYFGQNGTTKAYKTSQILAIATLKYEESESESPWVFDPDGMESRDE